MQTIKFIPPNQILLNKKLYKGYTISELPTKFAFIYNENKEQDGITEWFNYKGLTYVSE